MKHIGLMLIVCFSAFCSFAKEEGFKGKASINLVQDLSRENKAGEDVEVLKINTNQSGAEFAGVMHISIELEDKNDVVYFGTLKQKAPDYKLNGAGNEPTGAIEWEFEVNASEMKRPKITAYTVEYRYEEEGGESILLDEDYDKVKSPEELADRNKASTPIKIKKVKSRVVYPTEGGD